MTRIKAYNILHMYIYIYMYICVCVFEKVDYFTFYSYAYIVLKVGFYTGWIKKGNPAFKYWYLLKYQIKFNKFNWKQNRSSFSIMLLNQFAVC